MWRFPIALTPAASPPFVVARTRGTPNKSKHKNTVFANDKISCVFVVRRAIFPLARACCARAKEVCSAQTSADKRARPRDTSPHHPAERGLYWGGFVNTRSSFDFIPYDVFKCNMADKWGNPYNPATDFVGMEKLKPDAYKQILGLQAELWSETVKGGTMAEYYYLPKLIGFAERAWVGQASWGSISDQGKRVASMDTDWNRFANIVGQREMPRLDYLFGGFSYRIPPPGGVIRDGLLHANVDFPGLTLRYTTDGSEPNADSPLYSEPVEVSGEVMLRSFDTRGRGSRVSVVE